MMDGPSTGSGTVLLVSHKDIAFVKCYRGPRLKVFLTGMDGFVGGHLVEALLERGDEVTGTVLDPHQPLRASETAQRQVQAVPIDIRQSGALDETLKQVQPGCVFHLAAVSYVPSADSDPLPAFQTNVQGTLQLLEAVRRQCPQSRVMFVSSGEVYGKADPQQMPLTEDAPVRPANFYAATKRSGELWCEYYHRVHGLDVVLLRPFNHIGPRQSEHFVTSSFARQVAEIEAGHAEPVLQVGNLEAYRDFTDVRDVVVAYLLVAEKAPAGQVLQVCSGRRVQIRQIVDFYLSQAKVKIEVKPDPQRMRPSDVPERWGSFEKLRALTGWQPTIPLEETLQDILDSWRSHPASV